MSLNGHADVFGIWWDRRNDDRPKVFVTYKGGNNHKHDRFYADRHMAKPAVNHPAPAVHHKAPAPAPHNGKPAAAHKDHKGADRHVAMNSNRGNGGHFGRK